MAISEEFGDLFRGSDNWLKLYKQCTPKKYDFCYMKLSKNPPLMYKNFEKLIATGGTDMTEGEKAEAQNKLEKVDEN